ncbi:WGR domain-containing protein [Cupriavidus campinensis]|uniref:WGR domain-containing protein n=1 Tax=Cupriavidus campinensis TaxID=151783 RepID=A0ABY3ESP3_9BURK|nr:WGR domain-containing protein [Cupriavidus campinensis]TSP13981.1 WGR domain-containing protein [Cupriavidus campinensis]
MIKTSIGLQDFTLLTHEGGTKFYELTLLTDEYRDIGVLVRRWGKIAQKGRGGEVMIEADAIHAARKQFDLIAKQKNARGYSGGKVAPLDWRKYLEKVLVPAELDDVAGKFGLDSFDEFDDAALAEYMVPETEVAAPKPEPNRGADWGSW